MAVHGQHTRAPGYQPGNHWVECMRCGFDVRHEHAHKEWDGLIVCSSCWEPRHPQDLIRSVVEDVAAKGIVRPASADVYVEIDYVAAGDNKFDARAGIAIAGCAIAGFETVPTPPTDTL